MGLFGKSKWQKTSEELAAAVVKKTREADILLTRWNELVTRINDLGGEPFLNGEAAKPQFTQEELKQMSALCHPDKHGQRNIAVEISKKINSLRS